jgi:3-oxoacyl-[acyl-carrier-protein] synthase-3
MYINAVSQYFPIKHFDNQSIIDDYKQFGGEENITPELIYNQSGVNRRYSATPSDTAKDLGNMAAELLFKEWSFEKQRIEYLIFVSDALDYKGPTTACIMQHNLNLETNIGAIDILHGCTGWVYGLSLANALITSGQVNNVLLVTADVPTKIIHPIDVDLRALFSDAAAATLISNVPIENGVNATIGNFVFGTDGKGENDLKVERSGTKEPADIAWLNQYTDVPTGLVGGRMVMNSSKIFLFALRKVPILVNEILEKHKLQQEEIDFFILHQANGKMLDFIRKRMKIPKEKFIINIEKIGNTVSASIPIAINETYRDGRIKKGDKVLVAGFGIGLSWGGSVITF